MLVFPFWDDNVVSWLLGAFALWLKEPKGANGN